MSNPSAPDQPQHPYYDDEIDLKELVLKLWQRKVQIIGSVAVIALGSVAVLEDEEPKKVRPRSALIVALGIILGLMLGSFLALVVPVHEQK